MLSRGINSRRTESGRNGFSRGCGKPEGTLGCTLPLLTWIQALRLGRVFDRLLRPNCAPFSLPPMGLSQIAGVDLGRSASGTAATQLDHFG
eukprot:14995787-Alexandrium_andersonii.AAC.1